MKVWLTSMLALFASLTLFAPASAQVTTARLNAFVEDSVANYGDPDDYNFEDALFAIAKTGGKPAAVLDRFAAKLGVPRAQAELYANLILDVFAEKERCDSTPKKTCGLIPGTPLYTRVETLGLAEPTGGLLFAMESNFNLGWSYNANKDRASLAAIAVRHPAAADLLSHLYAYGYDPAYLLPLISSGKFGENEVIAMAKSSGSGLPEHALVALLATGRITPTTFSLLAANAGGLATEAVEWQGWVDAMLESAEQSAAAEPAIVRAAVAQLVLTRKFMLGLDAEAVAAWYAYPADVRASLPLPLSACTFGPACNDITANGYDFNDRLAAALWLTGHREDARQLLTRTPTGFTQRGLYDDKTHAALTEAMIPALKDSDLFDVFIEDKVPGWTRPESADNRPSDEDRGWLFSVRDASPAIRRVVAARLSGAGHTDMAAYLANVGPDKPADSRYSEHAVITYAAILPERLAPRAAAWRDIIAAADKRLDSQRPVSVPRVARKPLDPWWTEKKLPEGVKAWKETDKPSAPPTSLKLPVDPYAVLRYAKHGGEHAIVYASADYDLPGEIGAFGMWFAETDKGAWQRPVYLGLQEHFPYIVTQSSHLPMFSADGKLTLEIRVEEIDAETISFPPVGLGLKRNEGGLYLEFDLATLRADRDSDYLSDIEEQKLGLDFANPDTDGDGMLDGVDPLPLTALAKVDPLTTRVAQTIVGKIIGHDDGGIIIGPVKPDDELLTAALGNGAQATHTSMDTIFLGADPGMFADLSSKFRLMIYSEADIAALTTGAAPFYPPGIKQMFSSLDRARYYIVWSATWTGGTFIVTCTAGDGPCDVKVVSEWIT